MDFNFTELEAGEKIVFGPITASIRPNDERGEKGIWLNRVNIL
jgi:hypothetical protein